MTFSEILNDYLHELNATRAALARASGVSDSALSRYCTGEREPAYNGAQMEKLAARIAALAEERGADHPKEAVLDALNAVVRPGLQIEYDVFLFNLKALLKTLDVRGVSLARACAYDPSHISKVLSGQRRPGNIGEFTANIAGYLSRRYTAEADIAAIAALLGCEKDELTHADARYAAIVQWLGSNRTRAEDSIGRFLQNVDSFDLNAYIRAIHFDKMRLPTIPFQLPTTKIYTGTAEMMESELDFIRATVLSRSMEDCVLYSDMPIKEMADDPEFAKKWLAGMAMMLKKGLRLKIIHDVYRPFPEMMLGLEGNIPMYMTGQIEPYYLPGAQGRVFSHLLKVSGAAALEGSAIAGRQSEGRYVLTKSKEDLRFYRRKAERLLAAARPLMEIYRSDRAEAFAGFLRGLPTREERRIVTGSLPVFTLPPELLEELLTENGVSEPDARRIRRYRDEAAAGAEALSECPRIELCVPVLTPEQFAASPLNLSLSGLFFETDIPYTYEIYRAHLEATRAYAADRPNMILAPDPAPAFRNLSYTIVGERLVIVSKNKSPAIHFVIHHPKMVQAFLGFQPPIREPDEA